MNRFSVVSFRNCFQRTRIPTVSESTKNRDILHGFCAPPIRLASTSPSQQISSQRTTASRSIQSAGHLQRRIPSNASSTGPPAIEASHNHGSPPPAAAVNPASISTRCRSAKTALLQSTHTTSSSSVIDTAGCVCWCSGYTEGDLGWTITRCAEEEDVAYVCGGDGLEGVRRYGY